MNILEKSAYIKGLADGLDYDKNSAEGKLIAALIDLTGELCEYVADLSDEMDELRDYAEELDEDLGEVEEYLYSDDCDCDCDCDCDDDFECDGDCEDCDEDCDGFYEATCPHCGANVCFDETCDPRDLICPSCQERFDCLDSEA